MVTVDGKLWLKSQRVAITVRRRSNVVDLTLKLLEERDGRAIGIVVKAVLGLAAAYFLAQIIRMWWA